MTTEAEKGASAQPYTTADLVSDLVPKPDDGTTAPVSEEGSQQDTESEEQGSKNEGGDKGPGSEQGAGAFVPKFQSTWDQLKEDGIEIPKEYLEGKFGEGVSEFDALRSLMVENTEIEPGDPFVSALAATPPDQREDFIKAHYETLNFLQSSPQDGVRKWYEMQTKDDKGTPTYTKEAIDKYISNKSEIELDNEWRGIQSGVKKGQQDYYSKFAPAPEDMTERIQKLNTDLDARADAATAEIEKMDKYGNIPLTPEFKKDFAVKFKALSRINPKTGSPYIMNLIGNDKVLRDMVMAYELMNEGHVDAFLSDFKEDFKDDLLKNKLRVKQKPVESGSHFRVAQTAKDYL